MQKISNMNEMRMKRVDLLAALEENRANHRETFEEAQRGYRKAVIEELDRMLADARAGNKIVRHITWPEPEDHTAEYDRAIRMLQMCVEDEIAITESDFRQLVMDDWGWKASWADTVSNYARPK